MTSRDILIAIGVAVIWGLGFIASRLALDELSPTLMTALRFTIAAVPCLFVRRPKVRWHPREPLRRPRVPQYFCPEWP